MLKIERLENEIIKIFGSNKAKGPKQPQYDGGDFKTRKSTELCEIKEDNLQRADLKSVRQALYRERRKRYPTSTFVWTISEIPEPNHWSIRMCNVGRIQVSSSRHYLGEIWSFCVYVIYVLHGYLNFSIKFCILLAICLCFTFRFIWKNLKSTW